MIFDYPLWMYYNLIFTVLPVAVIGVLDQDVKAKTALRIPQIYASTKEKQTLFTGKRFFLFVLNAVYLSVISFVIPFCMTLKGALPIGYDDDKKLIGNIIACYGIIVANLTALMYMHSWDFVGTTIVLIETISFFLYIPSAKGFDPETPDLNCLYKLPSFWIGLVLTVILCLLPFIVVRFAKSLFCPDDLTIVKEMEYRKINYTSLTEPKGIDSPMSASTSTCQTPPLSFISNFSDHDTIPLKKTLSAPAFSDKFAYYRRMSLYDTKTKTEIHNTGYAFSYSEFTQSKEDDNREEDKTPEIIIPEAERKKQKLFNRHSMFIPPNQFSEDDNE